MKERRISELPNLPTALLESANKRLDKTALIYFGREFKYKDVLAHTKEYAALFIEMGVEPGDRVAIMTSNVPQFIVGYYGTSLAGGIIIPINLLSLPREYNHISELKIPKEIKEQIKDSRPKIIVAYDFYYPLLEQIDDELKKIGTQIILTSPQDYLPGHMKPFYPIKAKKGPNWIERKKIPSNVPFLKKLLSTSTQRWEDFPGTKSKPDDVAMLQYTSGSTGIPKGVMLTHKNLLSNVWQCRKHMSDYIKDEYTSMLAVLPFCHVFGMTVEMNIPLLSIGAPMVLVPDPKDTKRYVQWVKKYEVKGIAVVRKLLERLGNDSELATKENFGSIELFIHGAGSLPKEIGEKFEKLTGAVIFEGYGLTEASPVVSVNKPGDRKEGSAGKPIPDTEIKIIDLDTGEEIPPGTKEGDKYKNGRIIIKGPQVMKGYWNKPEETAKTLINGWLHTTDIGCIDEDGFLFITDREDNMIKNLGEKVFPDEVEKDLLPHPCIQEIAVIGVADDDLEALVVLNEKSEKNKETVTEEILNFARQNLPTYQVPKKLIIVSVATLEEYKNALGKVLKKKIREDIKKGILK